jgi:hypothetical protein
MMAWIMNDDEMNKKESESGERDMSKEQLNKISKLYCTGIS